jgi:hypothetical protein
MQLARIRILTKGLLTLLLIPLSAIIARPSHADTPPNTITPPAKQNSAPVGEQSIRKMAGLQSLLGRELVPGDFGVYGQLPLNKLDGDVRISQDSPPPPNPPPPIGPPP